MLMISLKVMENKDEYVRYKNYGRKKNQCLWFVQILKVF